MTFPASFYQVGHFDRWFQAGLIERDVIELQIGYEILTRPRIPTSRWVVS